MTDPWTIRDERTLRDLMTPVPHCVTVDQSVAEAWHRMRSLGIRHLPVMNEGRVVGVLGEREIAAVCEHGRADPSALAAGDVVSAEACFVAGPEMRLTAAVQAMATIKADCCAVVEHGRLTGILTSQDLVHLLAGMFFRTTGHDARGLRPSEVRLRILAEHSVLRSLYLVVQGHAEAVLDGETERAAALHERCRELYQTLLRHMELENTILAPALRETDAFGPLRADQLIAEHERQRHALFAVLAANEERADEELARDALDMIAELRADMAFEEQALLHPDLLKDDPITVDASGG